jgi:DNA-directed RNA polymerase I subunit RPA1
VGLEEEFTQEELMQELEECHRSSADLPRLRTQLDRGYKTVLNPATNAINSCCLPQGLIKKFPDNNLQLMVHSGAKVGKG